VLGITIDIPGGERYQGLVPLEGIDLAEAIADYLARSEQLDTRLWLWADEHRAAGLLIQRLPEAGRPNDWERIAAGFASVPEADFVSLPPEMLLPRIWADQRIRLFDPEHVSFRCGCSRERIESTLRALGRQEVMEILKEQGAIEADCEFCNCHYHLDRVDAERIFVETTRVQSNETRH
jgi:molecular chaperone Hsp33